MSSDDRDTPVPAGTTQADPLLAFADALVAEGEVAPARTQSEIRQFVTFFLRDEEYALPILQCREIVRVPPITRIPEAPGYVPGVVNLRGHIVPAFDTRARLGLDSVPPTARSRLIVVEVAGRPFALIVDRVSRILKLTAGDIQAPASDAAPDGPVGSVQTAGSVIQVLDAERVLCAGAPPTGSTTRGEGA